MNTILEKICRFCCIVWLCTLPIAYGSIALTCGDFTKLDMLFKRPHVVEYYTVLKLFFNMGLNLNIIMSLPGVLDIVILYKKNASKTSKEKDVLLNDTNARFKYEQKEMIELRDFLNKYNKNERYSNIMNRKSGFPLRPLLKMCKETYLENELEILKKEYPEHLRSTISIDDPHVGDMLIALNRLIVRLER